VLDEEGARVAGVPIGVLNIVLAVLTALTVALSMRIVGILLIAALMVLPVIAATRITWSMRSTLLLSILLGLGSVLAGLTLAYYADMPPAAPSSSSPRAPFSSPAASRQSGHADSEPGVAQRARQRAGHVRPRSRRRDRHRPHHLLAGRRSDPRARRDNAPQTEAAKVVGVHSTPCARVAGVRDCLRVTAELKSGPDEGREIQFTFAAAEGKFEVGDQNPGLQEPAPARSDRRRRARRPLLVLRLRAPPAHALASRRLRRAERRNADLIAKTSRRFWMRQRIHPARRSRTRCRKLPTRRGNRRKADGAKTPLTGESPAIPLVARAGAR
jgi:hypothetical protein